MPNSPGLSPGPGPLRLSAFASSASPRLTAKLTANAHDNRGLQRTTVDGYIRPELRRCGRRGPPEQLMSPRVEVPNGVGQSSRAHMGQ